jgi:hypothetical protein
MICTGSDRRRDNNDARSTFFKCGASSRHAWQSNAPSPLRRQPLDVVRTTSSAYAPNAMAVARSQQRNDLDSDWDL